MTDTAVSWLELDNSVHRNPALSPTTQLILFEVLDGLEKGYQITQRRIAEALDIGIATVGRGIRQAKEAGVLMMKRLSSKEWKYEVSYVPKGDHSPTCIIETNDLINKKEVNTGSYNPRVIHHSQEEAMPKITGPEGELKETISRTLEESKFGKGPIPTKYQVPQRRPRKKSTTKAIADYNVRDVWGLFQDIYEAKGFKGGRKRMATGISNRLRKVLDDFGSEEVVAGINYMFDNWQTLSVQHRGLGYAPSMGAFCGYSDTFIGNALNEKPMDTKAPVEWAGEKLEGAEAVPIGMTPEQKESIRLKEVALLEKKRLQDEEAQRKDKEREESLKKAMEGRRARRTSRHW